VFSFDPAARQPMNPDSVTHRFGGWPSSWGCGPGCTTCATTRPPSSSPAGWTCAQSRADRPRRRRRDHPTGVHAPPGGGGPASSPTPRTDAAANESKRPRGCWVKGTRAWKALPSPWGRSCLEAEWRGQG
jgi:hypothetical protein